MGDAVVRLVDADLVLVASGRTARQVARPRRRHALDQQAGRDPVVGSEDQPRVELLGLQHVVLEHLTQRIERLARIAVQRDHALVRLLARHALLRIERDRAAAVTLRIDQRSQPVVGADCADHLRGDAKREGRLDLGDRQLDRSFAVDLQIEGAVELDVRLHQHRRGRHFAEQVANRRRERFVGLGAPGQHVLPAVGEAHEHAAHRLAVEDEFVQFAHAAPCDGPASIGAGERDGIP